MSDTHSKLRALLIRDREWFGATNFFDHPSHPTVDEMSKHFPTLLSADSLSREPLLVPSRRGETIGQLHDRVATALEGIVADVDAEVSALEETLPVEQRTSKAVLICAHAAPLIAMGRVLTGRMPDDSSEEDFNVFTAGLSTFKRRGAAAGYQEGSQEASLAEGTRLVRSLGSVPRWRGRGVGGGWDCVGNGDCSFLSGGAERGWLVHRCFDSVTRLELTRLAGTLTARRTSNRVPWGHHRRLLRLRALQRLRLLRSCEAAVQVATASRTRGSLVSLECVALGGGLRLVDCVKAAS